MAGLQQLWSTTPGNNQTADPSINWREGQGPSTVNDSARVMMARLAAFAKDISGALFTGGTSTAYTLTTNEGFTALVDGLTVSFRLHTAHGVAPTLNVDGLGAKPLRVVSTTNIAGDEGLTFGGALRATYSAGNDEWLLSGRAKYLDAPVGTRMVFHQTAAPAGWVKEAGAGFNNRALRLTTGIVGSGGTSDFTAVFTSRTIAQANLPNVVFAGSTDAQGNHSHGGSTGVAGNHSHGAPSGANFMTSIAGGGTAAAGAGINFSLPNATAAAGDHSHTISLDGNHSHGVSVNSGGSGTALDFAVAYHDVIVAQKA